MKNILFVIIVIGIALGIVIYDKQQAQSNASEAEAFAKMEENANKVEKEIEEDSIDKTSLAYRARTYANMDTNGKVKIWMEVFNECPKMVAVINQQMARWGRSRAEQVFVEIGFYMEKGRHPKDFIENC